MSGFRNKTTALACAIFLGALGWEYVSIDGNHFREPKEETERDEELSLTEKGAFRLGTTRFRHGGNITSLAFVPKGKAIVSASANGSVRLWNVTVGREIRRFGQEKVPMLSVAISPDGSMLAAGTTKITVWNLNTGAKIWESAYLEDTVDCLAFSPDTKVLASAGYGIGATLWEATTGKQIVRLPRRPGLARTLAFSPDGSQLAYSSGDKSVSILATGKNKEAFVLTGRSTINSVAFSPDGKILATASGNFVHKEPGDVTLWSSADGKRLRQVAHSRFPFLSVAFLPEGNSVLAVGQNSVINLWDVTTCELTKQVKVSSSARQSISLSPDGKLLAFGGLEGVVGFLDLNSGKIIQRYEGHEGEVNSVGISPDNNVVISGSSDDTVRAWDISTRKELWRSPALGSSVMCVAISPNGKIIASGSGQVELWDLTNGKLMRQIDETHVHVQSLAFSPDGQTVASGDAMGTISIAETQSGRHVRELGDPETGIVCSICFSPNGKVLASARYSGPFNFPATDGIIQLWDGVTGKKLLEWDTEGVGIPSLKFSPDGKKIASVGQKAASFTAAGRFALKQATVSFWDSKTGKRVGPLINSPTGVLCVGFSPDGKTLATGHDDHLIRIWDMKDGKEKCELPGHQGSVSCLAFSRDGTLLVSGSKDTSVIFWELAKALSSSKGK